MKIFRFSFSRLLMPVAALIAFSAANAYAVYPGDFCSADGSVKLSLGKRKTIYENETDRDQGASWGVNLVYVEHFGQPVFSRDLTVTSAGDTARGTYEATLTDYEWVIVPANLTIEQTFAGGDMSRAITTKVTKNSTYGLDFLLGTKLTACP